MSGESDRLKAERDFTCRFVPQFDWAAGGPPPWRPLPGPLSELRLVFVTSGGFHIKATQDPFEGHPTRSDPSIREIPLAVDPATLGISHRFYDHRFAEADLETMAPLRSLQDLARGGRIGSLAPTFLSFMGYLPHWERIETELVPALEGRLRAGEAEAVLLSPG